MASPNRSRHLSPGAKARRLEHIKLGLAGTDNSIKHDDDGDNSSAEENELFCRTHAPSIASSADLAKTSRKRATPEPPPPKKFRPSARPCTPPRDVSDSGNHQLPQASSFSQGSLPTPPQTTKDKKPAINFDDLLDDENDDMYLDFLDSPSPSPLQGKGKQREVVKQATPSGGTAVCDIFVSLAEPAGSQTQGTLLSGNQNGINGQNVFAKFQSDLSQIPSTPKRSSSTQPTPPSSSLSVRLVAHINQSIQSCEELKLIQKEVLKLERILEAKNKSLDFKTRKIQSLQNEVDS